MSFVSVTAPVRPASGPVAAPAMDASRSCGTKAEREWEASGIIAPELALLTFAAIHEHRSRNTCKTCVHGLRLCRWAVGRNDEKRMAFSAPGGPDRPNTASAGRRLRFFPAGLRGTRPP